MNKLINFKDGKYYFKGKEVVIGRWIGGYFQTENKLTKLAEQIDDKDRQFVPKLGDNGFYF